MLLIVKFVQLGILRFLFDLKVFLCVLRWDLAEFPISYDYVVPVSG